MASVRASAMRGLASRNHGPCQPHQSRTSGQALWVVSYFALFSVPPLRSPCLGGKSLLAVIHRRGTETAEIAQRKVKLGHYQPCARACVPLTPRLRFMVMPEMPDIVVYIEALEQRILNQTLERVQLATPFLLRTAMPPITTAADRKVVELRRLGKRICFGLEEDLWLVLHLMIAGRLHWHAGPIKLSRSPRNRGLAAFQFGNGTLSLTEAGSKRRASLHLVQGADGLQRLNPGGIEIFQIEVAEFARVLTSANHTLKRALTDPRLFSGIGNAYSDEILFAARLSPIALTQKLKPEEIERLFNTTRQTLTMWIERLRADVTQTVSLCPNAKVTRSASRFDTARDSGSIDKAPLAFPEKVTAFRPEMAVHGKYGQPCPRCGAKIQRIRFASNETNYCPGCQTGGKLLADRALSRLLRADWPRTAEEFEGLTANSS